MVSTYCAILTGYYILTFATLLQADDTALRVEAVRAALAESIEKMRAMPPGPFEVGPPPGIRG